MTVGPGKWRSRRGTPLAQKLSSTVCLRLSVEDCHDTQLHLGLVSRTFDTQRECLEAAFGLAGEIASKSPIAVQGTKLAMNYARNHGVDDSIEWILTWNQSQLQTEDIVKNAAAMMSKEKALFNDV